MRKQYRIGRQDGRVVATVVPEHGQPYPLRHVIFHSPAGLEYGYGGSGPADLALSLLADLFEERPTRRQLECGESRAWHHHQAVKWRFVASLDSRSNKHEIDGDQVLEFCRQREEGCS